MLKSRRPAMATPKERWIRRLSACAVTGLLLGSAAAITIGSGCSAAPPPVEPPKPCDTQIITLDLYAAGNVNPNESGNPRPVVVRLYQLASDLNLQNARYDDVLLRPEETLGKDIMKVDEVSVFPSDHLQVKFERIKEASYLAGVALFHGPKGQSWKTFYEFPLAPGEAICGGRDAGLGVADPKTAFFLESAKIDNGAQMDESMFQSSKPVRKLNLPKKSAAAK
ncbi:MAG: type VI secretion system lipoprotein TssJ [Polyangiaceae bacterium]|nr:type VI secretion system lipoprotein TssJ [Polyangiaceae bacterium]